MTDLERGTGTVSQSQSTAPTREWAGDAALKLIKADVAKLVDALAVLASELAAIKGKLDRIEKTIREIALGLGVTPQ
jgi:predicted transcriptional regulator